MSVMTYLLSLGSKSEEDSSAGSGVGRDFFQVLPDNNWEYSPGLFPQEARKEIPKFARKKSWGGLGVEGILLHSFYTKSRQDVPPCFAGKEWGRLQGTRTLATSFFRQLGALSWPPPRQFGRSLLLHFFHSRDGEGSLVFSHNVERFSEKTMGSFPTKNEMV